MKFIKFIKKILVNLHIYKKTFCDHKNSINVVYIEDRLYDFMTDNDELDDIYRTFIKIKYCTICGKILSVEHNIKTNNWHTCYGFGKIFSESKFDEIKQFEKITGIKKNHLTLYKTKHKINKDGKIFYYDLP